MHPWVGGGDLGAPHGGGGLGAPHGLMGGGLSAPMDGRVWVLPIDGMGALGAPHGGAEDTVGCFGVLWGPTVLWGSVEPLHSQRLCGSGSPSMGPGGGEQRRWGSPVWGGGVPFLARGWVGGLEPPPLGLLPPPPNPGVGQRHGVMRAAGPHGALRGAESAVAGGERSGAERSAAHPGRSGAGRCGAVGAAMCGAGGAPGGSGARPALRWG